MGYLFIAFCDIAYFDIMFTRLRTIDPLVKRVFVALHRSYRHTQFFGCQ